MTTQLVGDRQLQIEEILGAFNLTVGVTFSGVAYGGTFIPGTGATIETRDPSTGAVLAHVRTASEADCSNAIAAALEAFKSWRSVPAPKRGEVVRKLGDAFRRRKDDLARLISLENGKIRPPAYGAMAPTGGGRDHLRIQLSGRGARLGLGARAGVRRHHRVEAVQ